MKFRRSLLVGLVLLTISGCSTKESNKEKLSLSVGVMPAVDALPIFVAAEKGYFEEEGLAVSIHQYTNAMDRDAEIQTGVVDGVIDDILGLITKNKEGFVVKATSSTASSFQLLTNQEKTLGQTVKVGMAEVSVTNYLSNRYLTGVTVEKVFINAIPQRMEMTSTGQIDMAVLPEPVASQGELNGLKKETITLVGKDSVDVLIFTEKALNDKEEEISRFYKAYNRAVNYITENDSDARSILVKQMNLNPEIKNLITLPEYKQASLPSEETVADVAKWLKDELKIESTNDYQALTDNRFVK